MTYERKKIRQDAERLWAWLGEANRTGRESIRSLLDREEKLTKIVDRLTVARVRKIMAGGWRDPAERIVSEIRGEK